MDPDEYYDGLPIQDLPLTEVDVPDPDHLQRSRRYPGATDIDPAAAIEAAFDWQGLIARDPNSATGEAIRIIEHSPTARWSSCSSPNSTPPEGHRHVATAWPASRQQQEMCTGTGDQDEQEPHDDHAQP